MRGGPTPPATADARIARVSLGIVPTASLSATGAWTLTDHSGHVVASGGARDRIALSSARTVLMLADQRGSTRDLVAPVTLVVASQGGAIVNDRRYRGELAFTPADSGVHVINRVPLEAYLRGVVPREIGIRGRGERAAVEAQAVAARSYAFTRLGNASRAYDLAATTSDQVYGGMDAENAVADAAVAATEGLVLQYAGRVVSAPYHSTCGGSTAEPAEDVAGHLHGPRIADAMLLRLDDVVLRHQHLCPGHDLVGGTAAADHHPSTDLESRQQGVLAQDGRRQDPDAAFTAGHVVLVNLGVGEHQIAHAGGVIPADVIGRPEFVQQTHPAAHGSANRPGD